MNLTGHGNLTFESLALDNLAWGNEDSVRDVKVG